jgi:uncharacterized protein (DUF2141 family)
MRLRVAQILGCMATTCQAMEPTIWGYGFCRGGFPLSALRAKVAVAALILVSTLTASQAEPAGRLSMTVTGVRNGDGVVRCALFNSPTAFPKPGQEWRGVIAPIGDQKATCVFTGVPPGNYAVAFFHAEHNETQLTPGLFGKPTQGYGFSNNATGRSAEFQRRGFSLRRRQHGAAGFAHVLRFNVDAFYS